MNIRITEQVEHHTASSWCTPSFLMWRYYWKNGMQECVFTYPSYCQFVNSCRSTPPFLLLLWCWDWDAGHNRPFCPPMSGPFLIQMCRSKLFADYENDSYFKNSIFYSKTIFHPARQLARFPPPYLPSVLNSKFI